MSKRFGTLVILALVVLFAVMGYRYLHYRSVNAVSDAAFIKSDRLAILSFKVDGKVVTMAKEPNEPVKKGDLLAKIEAVDYLSERARIRSELKALMARIEAKRAARKRIREVLKLKTAIAQSDLEASRRKADALSLKIAAARTDLRKLRQDEKRFADMLAKRLIAQEKFDTVKTRRLALARQIEAMEKELLAQKAKSQKALEAMKLAKEEQKRLRELDREIDAMYHKRDALKEADDEASRRVAYTELYAPFDGTIAKKFFDAPHVVKAGFPVYALADPKALYCEVLLSEKKLHGVKPGNAVTITVDAIEGKTFHGRVESIAPTSASTFSLVPRDIASGEFTKLDQRFVVRISLDEKEGLRAGMGATVAIERKGH
ncbi:HlyD family secretion protein [Hydrogenimonas sp.]